MEGKTFEEIVKAMTAGEIVMAMIQGLRKEHVKVDMMSYGHVLDGACYGCAATNAICEIAGHVFGFEEIKSPLDRAKAVNSDFKFLDEFETAIDFLRRGEVDDYNYWAKIGQFAQIKIRGRRPHLPSLDNGCYDKYLPVWERFANKILKSEAQNRVQSNATLGTLSKPLPDFKRLKGEDKLTQENYARRNNTAQSDSNDT